MESVRRLRSGRENASERRVCRVLGQPRATQRYESQRAEQDKELLAEMQSIAAERPCFGSRQVYEALRRQGREVNHKRVEDCGGRMGCRFPRNATNAGVYRWAGARTAAFAGDLSIPITSGAMTSLPTTRSVVGSCGCCACWTNLLARAWRSRCGGRSREWQVLDVLGYLFAVRGSPEHIRSDNGPEFVAGSVRR